MDNDSIYFDDFIKKFYMNKNGEKMILQIDIDKINNNKTNSNIYDIHNLLLDLLLNGFEYIKIEQNNFIKSIETLQCFFNNIDIKIIINNHTKKDLIDDNSPYNNRYARIDISDTNKRILNGQHTNVNDLSNINTFILVDSDNNLDIRFDNIIR